MPSNLTIKAVLKKYLKGFILKGIAESIHFISFLILEIERLLIF